MTEQTTDGAAPEAAETVLEQGAGTPEGSTEAPAEGAKPDAEAKPEGQKPEGDKASDADAKGENTDTTAEEQTIEFTPPEGMDFFKDQYAEFEGMVDGYLKENPNATAKQALKWAADEQAKRTTAEAEQSISQHNERIEDWLNKAKADEEIGGDKFDENVATAVKALDNSGDPQLREILNMTGLGNHPFILRMLVNEGKKLESGDVPSPGGPNGRKKFTDALYGAKAS